MKVYRVGGCVRDSLLGLKPHDIDYVVVGATPQIMLEHEYKQVGKEFPVFLHPVTGEEYALARKEVKTGDKHTDFKFEFGPDVTLEEDLRRRDFTMNAMAQDTETGEIIDPFNGEQDLYKEVIRHVDAEHFVEDPLRVLRGLQFSARFRMPIHESTLDLFKQMVEDGMLAHLTPERIWAEIEKALHTPHFYTFIMLLDEINALQIIFPEIYNLKQVPENTIYHPEGNAYEHVLLTLKQVYSCFFMNESQEINTEDIALVNFGLLCHDLGKAYTDRQKWPAHHGHDDLGLSIIDEMCKRLMVPNKYRDYAMMACKYHMKFYEYLKSGIKKHYDFLKETTNFKEHERLLYLFRIHKCDLLGREGEIAETRIDNMSKTFVQMDKEFKIMENIGLKDLPKEVQDRLSCYNGIVFGQRYREAMISYLKHQLHS